MQIKELYKKFLKAKGADIKYRNLAAGKKIDVSKKGLWDKKKKQVIVPSNRITMKGPNGEQDFFKKPVVATGLQSGQQVMMQPGGEYYFPNDKAVHEVRMQNGGNILSMGDYDLTTAPKRGNYLLPDINRPYYIDDAGERRTEYKIGINVDGKETLIPTVVDGRQLTEDEARDRYRKTGLHMGQFNTPEEADYAARLRTARYKMLEDPVNFKANQFQVGGKKEEDSTIENIAEFFDPTGVTSYDDASRAYDEWKKSNATLPSMSQALDMFGAVPALGKFGKIKYLADPAAMKAVYKSIPWQQIANAFDTAEDEASKVKAPVKKEYGGLLGKYQNGGMADINPNTLGFQEGGSVQTDITTPIRKKPSPSQDAFNAMLDEYEASKEVPEEDASVPEDMGFQSGGELPVVIDSLFSNFRSGIGRKYAQNGMAVPGVNGTVVANTNAPINSEKLKMQTGAWANWTPNTGKPYLRTSPAGNAGYSDNTKVVTQNTNVSAANRKAAEAAPHTKEDSFINSVEATLNPYNWGVTDYTKSGTRAQAFSAARKAGEKEFMWNNERFNTRKDTDPIKYTGANPNQEEYDEVLRTQYPEFFKLLNRGQNVGNISFEGSESLNGEFNRAFIQKNPNLLFSGNSKVAVGQNPHSSHEFISNLIAEAGHLKDNKLDKNILNPYTWKAALDDFKFGETKYNIPGTAEYNAHRLIEPGVSMVAYGNLSPNDVKRIQKNLGVEEDGYFGETTYKALQNKYKDNDYIQRGVAMHEYRTQDTDENPIGTGHYSNLSKRYLHELNKEVPLKYYDRFSEDTKRSDYTDAALLSTSGDNMNTLLLQHALKKRGYALPKSTINKPSNYNWSDSRYYNLDGKYGEETKNALLDWQNKNSTKKQNGGWLNSYEVGGEVPFDVERMQGVDIRKKRSWSDKLKGYVNQFEKKIGLDPYNERSDDFMEQWARRVNTATGGRDWYKQPNDGSGTGGMGTAMMETVMAPFSAPQLASVYGLTGKVQMPSEALNIQNPVGAFLTDTVLDPLSVLPAAAKLRGPLKSASKYLTTNTALKNTYKYNPLAFKPNPESYYRVMPDAGAEDLINSGFVRPAEGSPTSYFNKGVPLDIRRARTFGNDTREAYHGYKGPYMVESNNPNAFDPWLQFPEPSLKFYQTKAPIPASDIKLYKEDWLKGYKQIKKPGLKKGGETDHDDDKDMVNGVASILRRVKDPENRLQLANQLSKQFNREKVKYDLPSFLAKSKVNK